MKCNICDKDLSEKEIVWSKDLDTFEPCGTCLDVAFDAAFSDGFSRPDEDDYHVILEQDDSYDSALQTMFTYFKRGEEE